MCADEVCAKAGKLPTRSAGRQVVRSVAEALGEHGLLDTILSRMSDGLLAVNSDWRVMLVSDLGAQMLGLLREDMIGRVLWDLLPTAAGTQFEACCRAAAASRRPQSFEACHGHRLRRWFTCRCYPGRDGSLAIYLHDVTDRKQAESEASEFKRKFDAALQAGEVGTFEWDVLQDRLWGDSNFARLLAMPADPGSAAPLARYVEAIDPQDRAAVIERVNRTIGTGAPFEAECRIPGGEHPRWVVLRGSAERDAGGRVTRVVGAIVDETARKRAEETLRHSQERLALAREAAELGIYDYDIVADRLHWGPRTREMWGLPPDAPVSFELFVSSLHPDDRAAARTAMLAARDSNGPRMFRTEYRVFHADGSEHWISSTGQVLFDAGRPVRVVGTTQEITARKRVEAALASAKSAAEEANRHKDHFLALLGHELRNPLAPIRNTVAILQRIAAPDSQIERALQVIDRQVAHMTRLIDDLLDVSRVAWGKIKLQREGIDLTEVVEAAVEDHRPLFEASGVQLTFIARERPLPALADPPRIAQIVSNLVVNANKFTNADGSVVVEVTAHGQEARIAVRDTGIGMDGPTLESIFQPFAQADHSIARGSGGLGLGLALVKGFLQLHGGDVSVRSEGVGRGSEFVVTLPVLVPAPTPGAEPARVPATTATRRILIVEDNVDAAESLEELLRLGGHSPMVVHTGRSALDAARRHRPEVVLCDIGLPDGMDGYAVARAFRDDAQLRQVLLVAMTGYGLDEDKALARQAGFDMHLTKPVDPEALERLLAA